MIIIDKPIALMRELSEIRECRILTVDEVNIMDEVMALVRDSMHSFTYVELER